MSSIIDKVAWIHRVEGKVLCVRSKGKDTYYLPGGKREDQESDVDVLVREIAEELSVDIRRDTATYFGTFQDQAHDKADGVTVQMACYMADYDGDLMPAAEIAEVRWLGLGERHLASPVVKIVFDQLAERT